MSSSLPDGFALRRGGLDDVESVSELLVAEERRVRGGSRWTRNDTRDWFHDLSVRGEVWLIEHAGRPLGMVGTFIGETARSWICVDWQSADSTIGPVLLETAEQRSKARGAAKATVLSFVENAAETRLLERAGYRDVRHFYRMEIELGERPSRPEWPENVSCETFDVTDARAFHTAMNEAFADDYGHTPVPFEDWKRMRIEAPGFDPSLWFVAREREEIAGICRCTAERWGCGWIEALGVRRAWRRHGIGRALLQHSFRELYDRGARCVGLGVDTQNPSGATRLYERAGMHVVAENIVFEKAVV